MTSVFYWVPASASLAGPEECRLHLQGRDLVKCAENEMHPAETRARDQQAQRRLKPHRRLHRCDRSYCNRLPVPSATTSCCALRT